MPARPKKEPRRVYVVLNAETGEFVAAGTGANALREDFPKDEGFVVRTFVAESTVRPGGR